MKIVAIALVLAACGGKSASDWTARAPLPIPRADHALVTLDGKLFAAGGFSGSTLARVDVYDPAANSWSAVAPMLAARREFAAGVVAGKIYVACGMSWSDPNNVTYVTTSEAYDPQSNTWTARAPCPLDPAFNHVYGNVHIAGAAAAGNLYLVSFSTGSQHPSTMWAYDPASDQWAPRSPPPFTFARFSVAEMSGQLYALASPIFSNNAASQFAQYDPGSDLWILRSSLPGLWSAALASSNGRLFALGGRTNSAIFSSVNQYDAAGDRWSDAGRFAIGRHSAAAASLDGHDLWVTGGSSNPSEVTTAPVSAVEVGKPSGG